MNWLQKISGVIFRLEDAHKIAQPKGILALASALSDWANSHVPRSLLLPNGIDADGFDYGPTGTINWYFNTEEGKDIPMYAKQWIDDELVGYETNIRGPEKSGSRDAQVWRIDILSNPTVEYARIPEMMVSNDNTKLLMGMLNIPFDWSGEMDLRELRGMLARVTESQMREFERDTEVSPGSYEFGVDTEQLQRYIQNLTRIVDYGLSHGFKNIVWG